MSICEGKLERDVGFNRYNLHRIYLHVAADNERATRSYEKVGFSHEGRLREAVFVDGKCRDLLVMGLLNRDYREGDVHD
ncbi:MAG: GNAT family N-acetyltransferase [Anaerolineae bacterium]